MLQRATAAIASTALVLALPGCRGGAETGVVPDPPELTLRRDRYVLPPEPPPPAPRSVEERRRLEAEWPPVSPFSVRHRYVPDRAAPLASEQEEPIELPADAPEGSAPRSGARVERASRCIGLTLPREDRGTVQVRVLRARNRAAPEIVRILEKVY